jgi:3-hydroxyisobutyrate dehydrogenase-like beta-hydroxyacid dehydrogenase
MTDIGLIGVGLMGGALLHRMALAKHRVRAFDVSEKGKSTARELGAGVVGSAADAARGSSIVHVFVRTDDEVRSVMNGPSGVFAGAAPGTLVILNSTILPETTRAVAETGAAKGVDVIDAPVTSVPARVHAGEAAFLVGGPDRLMAKAREHLLPLGGSFRHFGPLGAGNVAKLAKNLANAAERVMISEVLTLAEAGGIDANVFFELLKTMDQGSLVSHWDKAFNVSNGHARPRPASNLFNKDVGLAAAYAASQGLDLPMTRGAAETGARWVKEWESATAPAE